MKDTEIIELARKAGLDIAKHIDYRQFIDQLTLMELEEWQKTRRFAMLVAQHTAEACAELADTFRSECNQGDPDWYEANRIAKGIRALEWK